MPTRKDEVRGVSLAALAFILPSAGFAQDAPEPRAIVSDGNPILADGRTYSTDPAPLVVGDTLYILAGRDEAPPDVNDFIMRSEEHTSELQSLMRISYAVFCLKKKKINKNNHIKSRIKQANQ